MFDYAQPGYWVVLFDEFDAIGKGRDNPFEHGELKRVVNTLLQLMDGFRGDSILIAATNHESYSIQLFGGDSMKSVTSNSFPT